MTRDELLTKLRECAETPDPEVAHELADEALIEYINDAAVTEAFEQVDRWYA